MSDAHAINAGVGQAGGHGEDHAHDAGHHHEHKIIPIWILRATLGSLLFFTLATVGIAQAETWVAHTFNFAIPPLLNVMIAMSIASVKTLIVVMFFMQLRYDSPMNTMVFVFTIMTVVFFLLFTALDLGGRETLDRQKAYYMYEGGTGISGTLASKGTVMQDMPANTPITLAATMVAKQKNQYFPHHEDHMRPQIITNAGFTPKRPELGSSPHFSRPLKGVTIPGLPGFVAPGDEHGHGDGHEPKPKDSKKPETAPNDPTKQ